MELCDNFFSKKVRLSNIPTIQKFPPEHSRLPMSIGLKLPHSCTYEHMIDPKSLSPFEILFLPKSFLAFIQLQR